MKQGPREKKYARWQFKLHEVIYEADTPLGKLFDIVLLIVILFSILLVMLESVGSIDAKYHTFLDISEWVVTILFTIEYILRIVSVKNPWKYVFSFYGMIDFLSTIPKYLSLLLTGTQSLVALRALRLLRIFRILKVTRYIGESNQLWRALMASRAKISIFIFTVIVLCIILGTVMYLVEGSASGFTSIPRSIYWCIVTLTTVGYGDIAPATPVGQFIASIVMILGYGIIAVPTGIITAEIAMYKREGANTQVCPNCLAESHNPDAVHCYKCGHMLNEY